MYRPPRPQSGYSATTDPQIVYPDEFWQIAVTNEQARPLFVNAAPPEHSSSTRSFNETSLGILGCQAYCPSDTRRSHHGLPRRATHPLIPQYSHVPQMTGYKYFAPSTSENSTVLASYFPEHAFSPLDFPDGIASPPATTSGSPTDASLLYGDTDLYSPTDTDGFPDQSHFNAQESLPPPSSNNPITCWFNPTMLGASVGQNEFITTNTQGSTTPVASIYSAAYPSPYSPTNSDGSATQPGSEIQGSRLPQVEKPSSPLECIHCGTKFNGYYQKGNLKRHIKSRHPELMFDHGESPGDLDKLKCGQCSRPFKRSDARKKHEWRTHGIKEAKPTKKY